MNKKILFIMVAILLVLTLVGCEKLYSITVEVNGNGTAAADVASASEGRTVTLTVTPDEGYELKRISVNGEEIEGTSFAMPAKDVTVVVEFAKQIKVYTVVFKNWDGTVLKTEQVEEGKSATAPATPVREADESNTYEFIGWSEDFSEVTSDMEVIAQFKAKPILKHTVTFMLDENTVYIEVPVLDGEKVERPADPEKAGYVFSYWSQSIGGRAFDFDTAVTGDIILYANWTEKTTFTVTFMLDETAEYMQVTVNKGEKVERPADPEKEGYEFSYWSQSIAGRAFNFDTLITSDITLYANWKEVVNFTVKFMLDETEEYMSVQVRSGDKVERPADPEKAGYEFSYWSQSIGGRAFDFDTAITGDLTLYANWTEATSFTVTFMLDDMVEYLSITVEKGEKVERPADPEKLGYEFSYWSQSIGGRAFNFDTAITTDLTLYANWKEVECFTVTFMLDETEEYISVLVNAGDHAEEPADPERDGYEFTYWSQSIGGKAYNFNTPVTADLTLYANWTEVTYLTVTFMLDETEEYMKVNVNSGEKVEQPADPLRSGYTFMFWSQSVGGRAFNFDTAITSNIVLYANWTESDTVLVTFMVDGEVYLKVSTEKNQPLVKPADPVKEGYVFSYWSLSEGGRAYDFSSVVTEDMILYANWETKVIVTVTFMVDGEVYLSVDAFTGETVERPIDPHKEGFVFLYWKNGDNPYDFATPLTGDLVLTAYFVEGEVTYHDVTFYVDDTIYLIIVVPDNGVIERPTPPEKSGWYFDCWLTEDGTEYDFTSIITEDFSLYASFYCDYTIVDGELISYNGTDKDLIIPEGVTFINGISNNGVVSSRFFGMGIKSVKLPSTLEVLGDYAFHSCTDLESVDFSLCSELKTIGHRAFQGCKITSIMIPASVTALGVKVSDIATTDASGIYGFVFFGCSALTSVEFEEGSLLEDLGYKHFWNCPNLKKLVIPASVTKIGDQLFNTTCALEELYVYAAVPPTLGTDALKYLPTTCKIYIPEGTYDDYADALGWMSYFDQLIEMNGANTNTLGMPAICIDKREDVL